jgi:hypothetical protein
VTGSLGHQPVTATASNGILAIYFLTDPLTIPIPINCGLFIGRTNARAIGH